MSSRMGREAELEPQVTMITFPVTTTITTVTTSIALTGVAKHTGNVRFHTIPTCGDAVFAGNTSFTFEQMYVSLFVARCLRILHKLLANARDQWSFLGLVLTGGLSSLVAHF